MFVIFKQTQSPDTNAVSIVSITKTHHDAYLQMITEAEALYNHYDIKKDRITHKRFVDTKRKMQIDLMFQEAPYIQKGENHEERL